MEKKHYIVRVEAEFLVEAETEGLAMQAGERFVELPFKDAEMFYKLRTLGCGKLEGRKGPSPCLRVEEKNDAF